jgi:membrane fusion protein, multidrug efflux system
MDWHDKRVKYTVIAVVAITAVISLQIFNKVMGAREKAKKAAIGKTIQVSTTFATRQTIKPLIKLTGNLDPLWQADLGAKVSGHLAQVYAKVGDVVGAGQVLATLDSGELTATANSAKGNVFDARASLASAETTLARYEKLYETGAISKADLDNSQFTRDMAAGKLAAAEGNYDNAVSKMNGTDVISPQAGTVVKRYFQEGYYATAGTALFNVADTTSLVAKINIPEGQIGGVTLGAKCQVEIPAMNSIKVDGVVTKIAQVADMPARTFAAEVTVDNSDNSLRGGLFANVLLQMAEKANALTVPQSAIVMREDQRTVYVVDSQGHVSRKVLDTGYIGDGLVEVLKGLSEKDEVVVSGQNRIREGSVVTRNKDGNS